MSPAGSPIANKDDGDKDNLAGKDQHDIDVQNAIKLRLLRQKHSDFFIKLHHLKEKIEVYNEVFRPEGNIMKRKQLRRQVREQLIINLYPIQHFGVIILQQCYSNINDFRDLLRSWRANSSSYNNSNYKKSSVVMGEVLLSLVKVMATNQYTKEISQWQKMSALPIKWRDRSDQAILQVLLSSSIASLLMIRINLRQVLARVGTWQALTTISTITTPSINQAIQQLLKSMYFQRSPQFKAPLLWITRGFIKLKLISPQSKKLTTMFLKTIVTTYQRSKATTRTAVQLLCKV